MAIRTSWIDPETHQEFGYDWGGFNIKQDNELFAKLLINNREKENEEEMKMDEMNKWLEDRGFEVTRSYDRVQRDYKFTIRKDGLVYSEHFTYSQPWKQESWMKQFVKNFEAKYKRGPKSLLPGIKNVIFSDPATIIIWEDGTKTVVKCMDDDAYSAETGLAMAICKKAYGNDNSFHKVFKKWVVVEEPVVEIPFVNLGELSEKAKESFRTLDERISDLLR